MDNIEAVVSRRLFKAHIDDSEHKQPMGSQRRYNLPIPFIAIASPVTIHLNISFAFAGFVACLSSCHKHKIWVFKNMVKNAGKLLFLLDFPEIRISHLKSRVHITLQYLL